MNLWRTLEPFITHGNEGRKVDLKLLIDLSKPNGRAEFAKDVSAMANTPGGRGYLVIGVLDKKDRVTDDPTEYIRGFQPDLHLFEQWRVQALMDFCRPVPEVLYQEIFHPQLPNRPIGVVVIPRMFSRPYQVIENTGKVTPGCFLRRGSLTARVDCASVTSGPTFVLINFGRQIESGQLSSIEQLVGMPVEETIDLPYQLVDTRPHEPQLLELLAQTGLTHDEWESLPIVVNVHPFAPDAAALMACIHGLRGNFPSVVRMARNPATEKFEAVEIMRLQSLRNDARSKVASA